MHHISPTDVTLDTQPQQTIGFHSGHYQGQRVLITPPQEDVKRIKEKAALMAQCASPYVPSLCGIIETKEAVSLVFKTHAVSLQDRLHQEEPVSWNTACTLVYALAQGLQALHTLGIAHGDLNIDCIDLNAEGCAHIRGFALQPNTADACRKDVSALGSMGLALQQKATISPSDVSGRSAFSQLMDDMASGDVADIQEVMSRMGLWFTEVLFSAIEHEDPRGVAFCMETAEDISLMHQGSHALSCAIRCPNPAVFDGLIQSMETLPHTITYSGEEWPLLHFLWINRPWSIEERRARIIQLNNRGVNYDHPLWAAACLNLKTTLGPNHLRDALGYTPFLYAVMGGDLSQVQYWLERGPDCISEASDRGLTALLCASIAGHQDIIQWLITEELAQISETDRYGKTAAYFAASHGHLEVLQWLVIEGGCEASVALLRVAARRGHVGVVQWLLYESGIRAEDMEQQSKSIVLEAIVAGHLDILRWLLSWSDLGGGVIEPVRGHTPLLVAASHGQLAIVQWLLSQGMATIHERNHEGRTALLLAASRGHVPVVRWLLSQGGAQITEVDLQGHTALLLAISRGHLDVVTWLLDAGGATESAIIQRGDALLLCSAYNGHLAMVQWLLAQGFGHIGARTEVLGNTPLLEAISGGDLKTVQWLLGEGGADITETNNDGKTPLLMAAYNGHVPLVHWLLMAVGPTSAEAQSALNLAIQHGHNRVVLALVRDGGVPVYPQTLQYAKACHRAVLVEMLEPYAAASVGLSRARHVFAHAPCEETHAPESSSGCALS